MAADASLVLTIIDEAGKQVRRLDLEKTPGCGASPGTCAATRRRAGRGPPRRAARLAGAVAPGLAPPCRPALPRHAGTLVGDKVTLNRSDPDLLVTVVPQ